MAKRSSAKTQIVRYTTPAPYRAAAPIIKVTAPRAAPVKKHRRGRRRGHEGGTTTKTMMGMVIGGFLLGYVDKNMTTMPTIPVLGKAGTIAVVGYIVAKHGHIPIAMDVAKAAAAVAAYEYGSTGKVSGDEGNGVGIASQI